MNKAIKTCYTHFYVSNAIFYSYDTIFDVYTAILFATLIKLQFAYARLYARTQYSRKIFYRSFIVRFQLVIFKEDSNAFKNAQCVCGNIYLSLQGNQKPLDNYMYGVGV